MSNSHKYWQLFWAYRKLRLMKMIEYRTSFIFWSVVSLFWTFFNLFFFYIITDISDTLGGWTKSELFIVVGIFMIFEAFIWSFFYRNMGLYTKSIFDGSLDLILTKPVDPQYLLSVQDNSYTNILRFLIGVVVLITSVQQLPIQPSIVQVLLFVISLGIGLVMIYSCWFILATFAFWIEKLDNINEAFVSAREMFRVPKTVYTGVFAFIFTILIPLLLITTVPAEVLIGRASWQWLVFQLITTAIFFVIARKFFLFSIKKYSSAGS